MSDKPIYPPMTGKTLGPPLLSGKAIKRIFKATKLRRVEGVTIQGLSGAINHAVYDTNLSLFSNDARTQKKEIAALKKHFDGYLQIASKLKDLDFPPMPLPDGWVAYMKDWFKVTEEEIERSALPGRKSDPRRTIGLVPKLLGIFYVTYGTRPTPSAKRDGASDGPTARFISAVIREVRLSMEQVGIDGDVYSEDRRRSMQWDGLEGSGLSKAIERALKALPPAHKGQQSEESQPDELATIAKLHWELWAELFEKHFLRPSQRHNGHRLV